MRVVDRGGEPDPEDLVALDSAGLKRQVAALNHYMKKAPKFKGEVHRGLSFGDKAKFSDFMQRLTQDSGFNIDAMSSFSSSKDAAKVFDGGTYGVMLNVVANQSGTSIKNASWHNDENEVLVPKGTKYRIVGPPRVSKSNNGSSLFEFDIEEIK